MKTDVVQEQIALDEEVRSLVADSIENKTVLEAAVAAHRLVHTYPQSGMSAADIRDLLIRIGTASKVAVAL